MAMERNTGTSYSVPPSPPGNRPQREGYAGVCVGVVVGGRGGIRDGVGEEGGEGYSPP